MVSLAFRLAQDCLQRSTGLAFCLNNHGLLANLVPTASPSLRIPRAVKTDPNASIVGFGKTVMLLTAIYCAHRSYLSVILIHSIVDVDADFWILERCVL